MSDRGKVILIFVIVGLLAGGGGFYFFKVYQPAQDLKKAQDEITAWEERFQKVRDCLLGKTPASSKTSEALAIREMNPDPWDRQRCTPLISKLSRGDAEDTGNRAVEEEWRNLDKAASKAAIAFARHVSESTTLENDPLPTALDELDAARRSLRATAKMPSAEAAGKPLAAAETSMISDGTDRLKMLTIDTIPSAHGMILFGTSESRTVQVKLTAGGAPEVRRVGPGAIRAVPDMTWGATPTKTDVLAGAFDAEGAHSRGETMPTTLALPKAPPPPPTRGDEMVLENSPTVAAVAGTLADGIIVFGDQDYLAVAKAKDGIVTAAEPVKITVAQAGVDVDGRVGLIWGDQKATKGQIMKPGSEEPATELPGQIGQLCLTKDRAWTQTWETAISFGGGRPTFKKELRERLQGCTADVALFRASGNPSQLMICGDDCRPAKLPPGAPQHSTTTVVAGKLIAIAAHAGVLGVWREGAQPVFYALPETATPVLANEWPAMALTDGKVVDVIARGSKGFRLIRVPAN